MRDTTKQKLLPLLLLCALWGVLLGFLLHKTNSFSDAERRALTQAPTLSFDSVLSGSFMSDFENYALDQFPKREQLRTLSTQFSFQVLHKLDHHGLYVSDGQISKLEYPLRYPMLDYTANRFSFIYESYLKEKAIVPRLVIIPDKNYYLAPLQQRLAMDYDQLFSYLQEQLPFFEPIDLTDDLSIDAYYETDSHWKQTELLPVASTIADAFSVTLANSYEKKALSTPFYGVYYGQSAMPHAPDTIWYLTNDTLTAATVTHFSDLAPQEKAIYDFDKANGKDPYDFFLSGATPLATIHNPHATNSRRLILFRDSFGSSLAPLLVSGYAEVTLVDLRYLPSAEVGNYVDFTDADVLFLYSTTLLNNSRALR